mgnify:CR=1 FL=1
MSLEKLQGMKSSLEGSIPVGTTPRIRDRIKNSVIEAAHDWLSSEEAQVFIVAGIADMSAKFGIDLSITNLNDPQAVRDDFDRAITKKINELVGTNFDSLRAINRDSIQVEAGRMIGEQLGVGPVWPLEQFRQTIGADLVASFDGGGQIIDAGTAAQVEQSMIRSWREPSAKAQSLGNLSARFGPPRDAQHAAKRAANRERQARYRKKNALVWVPLGFAAKEGNGRTGLSGKAAGNAKTVRNWLGSQDYNFSQDR